MTLLTYNDKIIKKLNTDLFKCFINLLGDEEIYSSFQQIVTKVFIFLLLFFFFFFFFFSYFVFFILFLFFRQGSLPSPS